ncbi:nSTAND1 domain-containing NTPase, partial [Streptomyces muensis]|nr:hypothetical protein [Streptomyces muensis]
MEALSSDSAARTAFAERLALLYKEAGNPPLKSVAEAVVRLQRVDERGRPVRVSAQRISDWRRARNVPAQFAALSAVLHVLIPQARRARPTPVSPGLYDLGQWQRLWERATSGEEEEQAPTAAEAPAVSGGVCPYRGLASYRQEDARWFFGRERSTDALVDQLRAVEKTGGLVMLVGASGAGKSSLLNAGLVPALRNGALSKENGGPVGPVGPVVQLVPGADPLGELTRRVPELAGVLASPDALYDVGGPEGGLSAPEASGGPADPNRPPDNPSRPDTPSRPQPTGALDGAHATRSHTSTPDPNHP